ncbi:hypothetical protein ASE02_17895 [Phenylobacterium sp. Root700]|nr:hypothetical protein ASE02_17895 [Phenylobacterium sp. Root700]
MGPAAHAPSWFRADKEMDLLRGEELAAAVHELAFAHQKQAPAFHPPRGMDVRRRIKAIRQIRFVQSVQRTYSFVRRASVAAEAAVDGEALVLRPPSHRYDFLHILAGELAQLAGAKRLPDIRNLVSAILPLLQANTPAERAAYLKRQGIRLPGKLGDGRSDFEDDLHDLGEDLVRGLVEGARGKAPGASPPPAPARPAAPAAPPAPASPLPPIDQVTLTVSAPQGVAPAAASGASGSGAAGRTSVWQPRTPAEMVRDADVGRRGEELVYRMEVERVRAMGRTRSDDDVVWTSQTDPGADHDIRSIGEDGQPIWIEVKTTTGTDGRFDWPRREFEKALREGARYQLWRVYNGASEQPEAKMFPDPIALIKSSRVRLEIGDLRAFVESRAR